MRSQLEVKSVNGIAKRKLGLNPDPASAAINRREPLHPSTSSSSYASSAPPRSFRTAPATSKSSSRTFTGRPHRGVTSTLAEATNCLGSTTMANSQDTALAAKVAFSDLVAARTSAMIDEKEKKPGMSARSAVGRRGPC